MQAVPPNFTPKIGRQVALGLGLVSVIAVGMCGALLVALTQVADLVEAMRDDEAWAPQLLAPLEVMGLDKMTDQGVFVRARIMTPPARRWAVARELNRRIKQHCDAAGLRLFFAKAPPEPPIPETAPA